LDPLGTAFSFYWNIISSGKVPGNFKGELLKGLKNGGLLILETPNLEKLESGRKFFFLRRHPPNKKKAHSLLGGFGQTKGGKRKLGEYFGGVYNPFFLC